MAYVDWTEAFLLPSVEERILQRTLFFGPEPSPSVQVSRRWQKVAEGGRRW